MDRTACRFADRRGQHRHLRRAGSAAARHRIGAVSRATERAAQKLGYAWINATIRADNEGGLVYYQSRGFRQWKHEHDVEIAPGRVVDRVCTRYDLD
jgi:L-amino acid N-acyltransferase YncA